MYKKLIYEYETTSVSGEQVYSQEIEEDLLLPSYSWTADRLQYSNFMQTLHTSLQVSAKSIPGQAEQSNYLAQLAENQICLLSAQIV